MGSMLDARADGAAIAVDTVYERVADIAVQEARVLAAMNAR
jgi:hypothetical protein